MKIEELKNFPSHVLFDLARNGSAKDETRRQAVEELIDRDDRRSLHPELQSIADKVLAARKAPVQKLNEPVITAGTSVQTVAGYQKHQTIEIINNPTPAQKEEFFTDGKEAK